MIAFEQPGLLVVLAASWTAALWGFGRIQRRAVAWIEARSAPRFRSRLTRYTAANLRRHLVLLWVLGLLLAVAAAGPYGRGKARLTQVEGRLVLLLDASISMGATDVAPGGGEMPPGEGGQPREGVTRFVRAQQIARRLVAELDGHRFGLATFSGVATFQLPATPDRALVDEALSLAELHTYQRDSGSDFTAALDAALHYAAEGSHGLQVVLLSDGEAPRPEDREYGDPLAALEEMRVPIHAIALGSEAGQDRVLWDLRTPAENRKPLREFTTRREEHHLRRMAGTTGGWFTVDELGVEAALATAVRERLREGRAGDPGVDDEAAREELAGLLLAVFLAAFVLEALIFGRRQRGGPAFDLERLGEGAAAGGAGSAGGRRTPLLLLVLLPLGLACGAGGSLDRAHRENLRGIAQDVLGRHDAARPHYRRSIGYGVQPQVPTHNLARSRALAGDWSEAHDVFQQALELDPDLVPALFNDGVALWHWGEAELDPRGCQMDRTLELWQAAGRRFAAAEERGGELQARALVNRRHVEAAVAEVEALVATPPPECTAPPPPRDEPPPPEPPPQGSAGGNGGAAGGPQPEAGGGGGAAGEGPLTTGEREEIRQARERLATQHLEDGKFFRRNRAEQFPRESWQDPDDEIWW